MPFQDISKKIDDLEDKIGHPGSEDIKGLEIMRSQIKKMEQYESFLSHPVTREVVEKILDWIRESNYALLDGRSIINEDRHKCIVRRDTLVDILSIFSPEKINYKNLENTLDFKISEWKKYRGP